MSKLKLELLRPEVRRFESGDKKAEAPEFWRRMD
jgi:hypothetical protein